MPKKIKRLMAAARRQPQPRRRRMAAIGDNRCPAAALRQLMTGEGVGCRKQP